MTATLSRLQPGMLVEFSGEPHTVAMVNHSRARIVPVARQVVTITTLHGKTKTFTRPRTGYDISPNSEIPILRRR